MTVNNVSSKITYAANGVATAFSFFFSAVSASDIHVFVTNASGVTTEVPPSQFTAALSPPIPPNPTSASGAVTYPLAGPPLATGNFLTIARIAPLDQDTSISNQSIIYPPIIEQALDSLALLIQQLNDLMSRSIKVPVNETGPAQLPGVDARKNRYAVFDASGNLTAGPLV